MSLATTHTLSKEPKEYTKYDCKVYEVTSYQLHYRIMIHIGANERPPSTKENQRNGLRQEFTERT